MSSFSAPIENARQDLKDLRRKASPFLEGFARFGYAAKGVVYVIVGGMAAAAAVGAGGDMTGSRGAFTKILEAPFGRILLVIVALGIVGYCLWQFIRAIEDPEGEGSDAKAIAKRIAYFGSGVIHLGIVLAAVRLLTGNGHADSTGDGRARDWTAWLMSFPFGIWLVAIVGASIAGYGLWRIWRAWRVKLDKRLALGELSPATHRWVVAISRFGIAARGVIFIILGGLLMIAAWRENPSEARGVGGALRTLEQQPYGPWLLAAVALGLIAYGIYEFVRARYRLIRAD
jgi:hypothetical protein